MKVPKAEKLPSGNWRVQIMIKGKRYSLTAPTKKEAQQKAKEVYAGAELEKRVPLTVGKAIDNYISMKENVLSPSTIRGYKNMRKNDLQSIMWINVSDLTQADVQQAVGRDSMSGKSAKSVRNAHGLLAATMKTVRPNFVLNTRLPQKTATWISIPSEEQMRLIWKQAEGTRYELPILLGSWVGLRMSEIKGLKYSDIDGDIVHIQRAVVKGPHGYVEKGPKTTAGDRYIKLPEPILNLIKEQIRQIEPCNDDYIVPYKSDLIYQAFIRFCEKAGIQEHYRFHDLRHFAASEAHALGIPDKYAMKRMGHATDNMLKNVYQHTLKNKELEFSDVIDKHMEGLYYGDGNATSTKSSV